MSQTLKNILISILVLLVIFAGYLFFNGASEVFASIKDFFSSEDDYVSARTDKDFSGVNNGGFTFEEIKLLKELSTNPQHDDFIKDFIVTEYIDYVVIQRKVDLSTTKTIYPNLLFKRSEKGLIWDGAVGVTGYIKAPNFFTGKQKWATLKFDYDYSKNFDVETSGFKFWFINTASSNVVTFSHFKNDFVENMRKSIKPNSGTERLKDEVREFLLENVVHKYFQDISDLSNDVKLELITDNDNDTFAMQFFNSFATYIWQNSRVDYDIPARYVYLNGNTTMKDNMYRNYQVNGALHNNTSLDISHYFVPLIADTHKIEIKNEDKSNYPGLNYYPIWDAKTIGKVDYYNIPFVLLNRKDESTKDKIKRVEHIDNNTEYDVADVIVKNEVSLLTISFNNKNKTSLTNLDLKNDPLIIIINDRHSVIDSLSKLNKSQSFSYKKGTELEIQLTGSTLNFKDNNLNFVLDKNYTLKLDYEFHENKVNTQFKLFNASTSIIDLASNNIVVNLKNKTTNKTTELRFNSNDYLTNYINVLLEKGEYEYSVIANNDIYIFADLNGVINISSSNMKYSFSFGVKGQAVDPDDDVSFFIVDGALEVDVSNLNLSTGNNYNFSITVINKSTNNYFYKNYLLSFSNSDRHFIMMDLKSIIESLDDDYLIHIDLNSTKILEYSFIGSELIYTDNYGLNYNMKIYILNAF